MPQPATPARLRALARRWAAAEPPYRRLVWMGTLASIAILAASVWTGFLGTASSLWSLAWFTAGRSSAPIVIASGIVLIVATTVLLAAWILLGRRVFGDDPPTPARIVRLSIAWAAPLVFSLPLFSRDVFSYIAQGRLLANGFDPYRWGIDSVPGWQDVGVDSMWTSTLTPYGPIMLALQKAIALTTAPIGYHATILAYRLVAMAGIAVAIALAVRIASDRGISPSRVLWMCAANPMVLFSFVVAAHNDAIMLALILAGLLAAQRGHRMEALGFITLAIGVKSVAVVALPVIGLMNLSDRHPSLRTRMRYWTFSLLGSLAILGLLGATLGLSMKWVILASTPAIASSWFAPSAIVAAALAGIGRLFRLPFEVMFLVGKGLGIAGSVAAGGYFLLTRREIEPLRRLTLAFGGVLLFSPIIYPWYLCWPLFIAAAAGHALNRYGRLLSTLLVLFFVGKDVIPTYGYSANALFPVAQGVLTVAAFAAMAALLVLEASTRPKDLRRIPKEIRRFALR